ncbi:hypothetical protein AB0B54_33945 [Microbispora bryophytorum]|uniref:hypothetical protein n=1 Tax=Microbispora bryophytorum TaxID=1460882 RepID=UPI00340A1360
MSEQVKQIHSAWIKEDNARVVCEILALLIGYEFDDLDWQAVGTALPNTDDEQADCWYEYPLIGTDEELTLRLAQSVGGSVVSVEVLGEADNALSNRIELVCNLAGMYTICRS